MCTLYSKCRSLFSLITFLKDLQDSCYLGPLSYTFCFVCVYGLLTKNHVVYSAFVQSLGVSSTQSLILTKNLLICKKKLLSCLFVVSFR